jgi:hypothetical protein
LEIGRKIVEAEMDLTKPKSKEDGWCTMATYQGLHCARSCFLVVCSPGASLR